MSSFAVVTTFSPKGYRVYGRPMIETFAKHWPADVPLYVYYEGETPADANPRAEWLSLDTDPDRSRFMAEHRDAPYDGKHLNYGQWPVTYCHKVFAYTAAPRLTDYLIWLDGDTETFGPVTQDLLERIAPGREQPASYLGRPWWRHSETGFICFNLRYPDFLNTLRAVYTSGRVDQLPEQHDCAAFDDVRRRWEWDGHRFRNLSAKGFGLEVFEQTELAGVMRHNKGAASKMVAYGRDMLPPVEAISAAV